jgi:phosphatidylserine/phosphatidylglycerophosphate/cardiolipin synthase-like enzyme
MNTHRPLTTIHSLSLLCLLGGLACTSAPARPPAASLPAESQELAAAFDRLPKDGGQAGLRTLSSNVDAWAARWTLLSQARRTIDVVYFGVENDTYGLAFLGHLLHKAEQGVKVRLVIDARGSAGLPPDYLEALVRTGNAQVRIYNNMLPALGRALLSVNPAAAIASTHDKILVVDGQRSLTGGRNIGHHYFADVSDDPAAWIDCDLLIDGEPTARALTAVFERELAAARDGGEVLGRSAFRTDELQRRYRAMDAWLRDAPVASADAHFVIDHSALRGHLRGQSLATATADVRVLNKSSMVDEEDNSIMQAIFDVAMAAEDEIFLQTPYFVLHQRGLELLTALHGRGVKVNIITNSPMSSDSAISQALFVEQWPELMAAAPNLRLFVVKTPERLMHAKRAVIDDKVVFIGTYNLDPLSRAVNSEVAAVAWSEDAARATRDEMRALIASDEVVEYRIKRGEGGRPLRFLAGHPRAGRVQVAYGPRDHTAPARMDELWVLAGALRGAEPFAGAELATW